METDISERCRHIIVGDRLREARQFADETDRFCAYASLAEIAAEVSDYIPPREFLRQITTTFGEDTERGVVPPEQFLNLVERFSEKAAIKVQRILGNPSFMDHFRAPQDLSSKVHLATETQTVERPHLRVMAKFNEAKNSWITHAEVDDGTRRATRRIALLEMQG